MADTAVAITAGAGTNIDTRTEATNGNHRQVVVLGDPATNAGVAPVDATAGLKVDLGGDNDVTITSGTVTAVTAITNALPAGTNAIGKLAANSGVDIGDVDVTSVIAGVGATNLGKAIDAVAGATDTGVAILAVRKDTAGALAGTEGDYIPLSTDASGLLRVSIDGDTVGSTVDTEDGTVATGQSSVALTIAQGYEYDGTNWTRARGPHTVAHDAADAGNPEKLGAKAKSALSGITLVASDDRTDLYADLDGVLVARPYSLGDVVQERTTNTDGASVAFASGLASPGAGVRLWVTQVTVCNSSATFCTVDLRDGQAGSVLWTLPVPATGGVVQQFSPPLKLTAATALAFDASAAITTLTISANAYKSKV